MLEPLHVVVGAVGAAAGAILSYILKRRQNSGTVQTSDAQALWEEGRQMRAALRDQLADCHATIRARDEKIAKLEAELDGRP